MIMQSLGLEVRKIGSMPDLFKEVDMVLGRDNKLESQTVVHALQKMFRPEQYCDVCNIKTCAEICGIVIPLKHLNIYQTLHCMHWNEMSDEYRGLIIAMILGDFRTVLCSQENK